MPLGAARKLTFPANGTDPQNGVVPGVGLEPTLPWKAAAFGAAAYTNFATPALQWRCRAATATGPLPGLRLSLS